ncbi:hypothetical protein ACXHPX_06295, partial [Vibrio cincinnatiensis]
MKQVMLYCRAGFEKECAGEIQDKASQLEVYGFPRLKNNTGYVLFECYQDEDADKLIKQIDFQALIFLITTNFKLTKESIMAILFTKEEAMKDLP